MVMEQGKVSRASPKARSRRIVLEKIAFDRGETDRHPIMVYSKIKSPRSTPDPLLNRLVEEESLPGHGDL